MIITTYACNQCKTQAQGEDGSKPEGWIFVRWHPGLVDPPDAPLPPKPKHFCTKSCLEQYKTENPEWASTFGSR